MKSTLLVAFCAVIPCCALAVGCVSTPTTTTTTAPAPVAAPRTDLEGARLCRIIADVDDAAARSGLGALRQRFEATASSDRHAAFGAMLSVSKIEDRFRAFHDDGSRNPSSAAGPLGECLVYAEWKMANESTAPCTKASKTLGSESSVVDVARVKLLARTGDAAAALAVADAALLKAPSCEALVVARAIAVAAGGDVEAAKVGWAKAQERVPNCFICALERAKLLETTEGRAAAAGEYERALKLAPDHADTLRRFAASVSGVDDVRALAAYSAAVDAGAKDFATLTAASRLAARLATTPDQLDRALVFAKRAADAGRTDPDARRLVVDLAMKKGDHAGAETAARSLLDLVPDDVVGHVALARAALKAERLEDAVVHFDLAQVELSAGRTAGLDAGTVAAVRAERQGLLAQLMVDEATTPKGSASSVANMTQRGLQKLWKERLKKKVVSTGGTLTVVVETDASGAVVDVLVKDGEVKDPALRAATVAWLRRANISGGARRYTLDLSLL
ncbi:MAG: hypothetical protein Q8O67_22450 [Deltaproteobacteria bacterium]|nr:hypothetical protein [Deltaproteobacteria bacterium]